jgi:hypothetical protein
MGRPGSPGRRVGVAVKMPRTAGLGEAFSRVGIDSQLRDVGWSLTDGRSVRYEYPLPDGTRATAVQPGHAMVPPHPSRLGPIHAS